MSPAAYWPREGSGYRAGMADDFTHYDAVEAYCDRLSYLPGEGVALHAWCAPVAEGGYEHVGPRDSNRPNRTDDAGVDDGRRRRDSGGL